MKILMDMQAIQSDSSRNRGIGRYTQELSIAIIKNIPPKSATLLLNALFRELEKEIKEEFTQLKQEVLFSSYSILDASSKTLQQKIDYNKLNGELIKFQLNQMSDQDIFHIHSPFEGVSDKTAMIHECSSLKSQVVVTLYDLIPLIYKEHYLNDFYAQDEYYKTLRLLYEADYILAISEATAQDAINILGIPEHKVLNISGSIDNTKFYKLQDTKACEKTLQRYGITQPFLMYTGGIDFRKNISAAIEAFSKIEPHLLQSHQFVIVCKIYKDQQNKFEEEMKAHALSKEKVIFTNFISDEELNLLYNAAKLFIFPSIYEGFGLPVLEAMSCGRAVIGSNSSSIPEIIAKEEALFDPLDTQDIASKINTYLGNNTLLKELEEHCTKQASAFSWETSAKKTIQAYHALSQNKKTTLRKQKVALFSPLPKQKSGISDYMQELLPFLSKHMDIDIFIDDYIPDSDYINANYAIYSYRGFEKLHTNYDAIIYQFGNSEFHAYMYDIALKHKGIVVLHDFYLSGLVGHLSLMKKDKNYLFEELDYTNDTYYKKQIINGSIAIDALIKELPLNKKIIDSATSIIVHSEYAKNLFKHFYEDEYDISQISQIIKTPSKKLLLEKQKYKKRVSIDEDEILISAFGHIIPTKQYDFIIQNLAEAKFFEHKKIKLAFVGEFRDKEHEKKITSLIKKYNLQDKVVTTGFVDDEKYKEYLLASDVGINLRVDSRGETSRALLMNMAYALPSIVNDYATFSELPHESVVKIKLNSNEEFVAALKLLLEDRAYREKIAQNAFDYIIKEHNPCHIAKKYHDMVLRASKQKDLDKESEVSYAIEDISSVIAQNSLEITDNEYLKIAKIIKQ